MRARQDLAIQVALHEISLDKLSYSRETRTFFADHPDQLTVYQLPAYSPDYNPIEYLWKKVKTKATHNRYFAEFSKLVRSVEEALSSFDAQPQEILHLMGFHTESQPNASAA